MQRVSIAGSRIAVHAIDAEVLATNAVEQMRSVDIAPRS